MLIPSSESFYELLQVRPDATSQEIRDAFLRLAKEYHPDLNRVDADADCQFKSIRRIYEILSDPIRRAAYDEKLARSRTEANSLWSEQDPIITRPDGDTRANRRGLDPDAVLHPIQPAQPASRAKLFAAFCTCATILAAALFIIQIRMDDPIGQTSVASVPSWPPQSGSLAQIARDAHDVDPAANRGSDEAELDEATRSAFLDQLVFAAPEADLAGLPDLKTLPELDLAEVPDLGNLPEMEVPKLAPNQMAEFDLDQLPEFESIQFPKLDPIQLPVLNSVSATALDLDDLPKLERMPESATPSYSPGPEPVRRPLGTWTSADRHAAPTMGFRTLPHEAGFTYRSQLPTGHRPESRMPYASSIARPAMGPAYGWGPATSTTAPPVAGNWSTPRTMPRAYLNTPLRAPASLQSESGSLRRFSEPAGDNSRRLGLPQLRSRGAVEIQSRVPMFLQD